MKKELPVLLDRLHNGHIEKIDALLPPEIMQDSVEDGLVFQQPVAVKGDAYLTDEFLIIQFQAKTEVVQPCSFCNTQYTAELQADHYVHEEPVDDIKGKTFDAAPIVREALLLELSLYPLCGGEVCLKRPEIEPFLRKEAIDAEPTCQNPFLEL